MISSGIAHSPNTCAHSLAAVTAAILALAAPASQARLAFGMTLTSQPTGAGDPMSPAGSASAAPPAYICKWRRVSGVMRMEKSHFASPVSRKS